MWNWAWRDELGGRKPVEVYLVGGRQQGKKALDGRNERIKAEKSKHQ